MHLQSAQDDPLRPDDDPTMTRRRSAIDQRCPCELHHRHDVTAAYMRTTLCCRGAHYDDVQVLDRLILLFLKH